VCGRREEEPLVDAAAVFLLGDEEEPNRGPRDDLIPLAEQEVDDERQPDRDDRRPAGQERAEDGEQRDGGGVRHGVRRRLGRTAPTF
jgi:hypothetical protein